MTLTVPLFLCPLALTWFQLDDQCPTRSGMALVRPTSPLMAWHDAQSATMPPLPPPSLHPPLSWGTAPLSWLSMALSPLICPPSLSLPPPPPS